MSSKKKKKKGDRKGQQAHKDARLHQSLGKGKSTAQSPHTWEDSFCSETKAVLLNEVRETGAPCNTGESVNWRRHLRTPL